MLATRETMPSDESVSQQLSQGIGKSLDVHLVVNANSLRPLVVLHLDQLGRGRRDAMPSLAQLLEEVESFELRGRLSQQLAIGAVIQTESEAAAGRAIAPLLKHVAEMNTRLDESTHRSDLPIDTRQIDGADVRPRLDQLTHYLRRSLCARITTDSVRIVGQRLQWGIRGDATTQTATCAALSMLLNPAAESMRPMVEQWQSMDGMQRLSEAMIAYAKRHAHFPAPPTFPLMINRY